MILNRDSYLVNHVLTVNLNILNALLVGVQYQVHGLRQSILIECLLSIFAFKSQPISVVFSWHGVVLEALPNAHANIGAPSLDR